ncbi:MAG: hypothetical protein ACI9CE_001404 [Flavobacterium sp.]|jgi:hypothetical protein
MNKYFFVKVCFGLCGILLLASCAHDQTNTWKTAIAWSGLVDQKRLASGSHWAIDHNVNIYVAAPDQVLFDDHFHEQLTQMFQRYYPKTRAALHRESLQQSLVSAQFAGMDYLVYPKIRDRITRKGFDKLTKKDIKLGEMRRGKVDMDILIYDTNTEGIVDHLQIETKASIFSAEETSLIWPPLNAYLKNLSQYSMAETWLITSISFLLSMGFCSTL